MKLNKNKLCQLKKALLSLEEIATEEGVTLVTDNDMEVGVEVYVNGDEGLVPASDGDYTYNGKKITVEGGVITAIVDSAVEEVETPEAETEVVTEEEEKPTEEEEKKVDETAEEIQDVVEDIVNETATEDVEALKTRIAELEALVDELKAKLEEPVAESVEEEMKREEKKNEKTNKMDYVAAMRKAREIKQNKINKE
jgi:hypothetical protein